MLQTNAPQSVCPACNPLQCVDANQPPPAEPTPVAGDAGSPSPPQRRFQGKVSWPVILTIVILLGGNGAWWSYLKQKNDDAKLKADADKRLIELQKEKAAALTELVKLADESLRATKTWTSKTPDGRMIIDGRLFDEVRRLDKLVPPQIEIYEAVESQLASIEKRDPKKLPPELLRLSAPINLKIQTSVDPAPSAPASSPPVTPAATSPPPAPTPPQ